MYRTSLPRTDPAAVSARFCRASPFSPPTPVPHTPAQLSAGAEAVPQVEGLAADGRADLRQQPAPAGLLLLLLLRAGTAAAPSLRRRRRRPPRLLLGAHGFSPPLRLRLRSAPAPRPARPREPRGGGHGRSAALSTPHLGGRGLPSRGGWAAPPGGAAINGEAAASSRCCETPLGGARCNC